ncbi:MAG: heat-inducible transcriptional repressor HrcA [Pseudomonadota bacterium]
MLQPWGHADTSASLSRELSERAATLLQALVGLHIRDGQPVGSRTLGEESGLSLSPATIRNGMAELEDLGFLRSPHTSAGRIPTAQGYRFFVDAVLQIQREPQAQDLSALRDQLNPDRDTRDLVQTASTLLSSITSQAGLVTVPRPAQQPLRQVEFLPLSGDRVLVILVLNQREVQNRIIHTRRVFSEEELRESAREINQRFAGRELGDVRDELQREFDAARSSLDRYLADSLDLAQRALADEEDPGDCLIVGETRLLENASPEELDGLRQLLSALEQKQDLLHLLERCSLAEGVRIFIGEEVGTEAFEEYALVTAAYGNGERPLGVLGVIGPTRMAYERVIPIVDVTSRMLSRALGSS